MKNKKLNILLFILCLLPVVVGIIMYPKLPDQVVTHFGADGQPDGWSNKFIGVILLPSALALLSLFVPRLIRLDPKNKDINPKLENCIVWIISIITIMCSLVTILNALGYNTKVEIIIPCVVGIMLMIIGNYLPKAKQNYTVGVKIPWTLNDEENWDKTHRVAGFVFTIGGFLIALSSFFKIRTIVLLAVLFAMIFIPTIYSYVIYRKKQTK